MFYSEALQGLVVHQEQDLDVWIPIDIVFSTNSLCLDSIRLGNYGTERSKIKIVILFYTGIFFI